MPSCGAPSRSTADTVRITLAVMRGAAVDVSDLDVVPGATVSDAIYQAASGGRLTQAEQAALGTGLVAAVFGRLAEADRPLFEGDRLELLEALRIDPKLARRRRVADRRAALSRDPAKPGG